MNIHLDYDLFSATAATAMTMAVYRWRLHGAAQKIEMAGLGYALALIVGALTAGNDSAETITAIASIGFFAGMLIFAWNALPVLMTA